MQGEIAVAEVMDRVERLKSWRARQRRDAEWVALKQWWRAEARVRRAQTESARAEARNDRAKTAWLYRAELARAWPRWRRMITGRRHHDLMTASLLDDRE
jgi:hypothetical protein